MKNEEGDRRKKETGERRQETETGEGRMEKKEGPDLHERDAFVSQFGLSSWLATPARLDSPDYPHVTT